MKCGDLIRLEHLETFKNLHSHQVQSPISRRNEVSAFGDEGEGDVSDNWKLECIDASTGLLTASGEPVFGSTQVQLRHEKTNGLLTCERVVEFTEANCPRCPINGQLEAVTQARGSSVSTRWTISSGMFFPLNEK